MNQRVIFLHYHGIGHINPCMSLADILEGNGFEVYFAGVEFFKQYVTSQGFSFYGLKSVPFGLGFETWLNTIEKKEHVYLSTLQDRITDRLYLLREKELVKMLDDLEPDVILLDATQSTDFIVLYPHLVSRRIKIAMLHAMLPTHVIPGRPPVNSYAVPDDKLSVWSAIFNMKRLHHQKAITQKIKYFLFDDQLIIKRRLKKNKIPLNFISDTPSLFNYNVRGITALILAPREFDFPGFKVESYQHYIGFLPHARQIEYGNKKFDHAWEKIRARKLDKDLKLIYCSFGTIESSRIAILFSFLEKLSTIAEKLNHLLVVSIKDQGVMEKLQTNHADLLYLFSSVPQIEVLRDTDLFVTHGGLSSIKESIDAVVPMLMYPVHADYDPKGNAARVVFHGMGLRGDVKKDSMAEIENKITELLSNKIFKQNISKLKSTNAVYTPGAFLSLLNQLVPL